MSKGYYLFTGGAGYIGSHVLRFFLERDAPCLVLDNLSKGHREAVPPSIPLFSADISDEEKLQEIFRSYPILGILHFAGFIEVGESMKNPTKYLENNVAHAFPLLETAKKHEIPWILFSSSAAVYGEPKKIPIEETSLLQPTNIYGWTKLIFEQLLQAYHQAFGIRSIFLRYFNAAGAHPSGDIGEDHEPESHLIPLACKAALGKIEQLSIYGNDYPTRDGTCIRDYVHIQDLAMAHWLSAKSLEQGAPCEAFNLGSETGYSVKEVVAMVEKISGKKLPVIEAPRRQGDAAVLVASCKKFREKFGWEPKHSSLEEIVASAWEWHSRHPEGYKSFSAVRSS
jgi:UDP-glucose 4-epimerase